MMLYSPWAMLLAARISSTMSLLSISSGSVSNCDRRKLAANAMMTTKAHTAHQFLDQLKRRKLSIFRVAQSKGLQRRGAKTRHHKSVVAIQSAITGGGIRLPLVFIQRAALDDSAMSSKMIRQKSRGLIESQSTSGKGVCGLCAGATADWSVSETRAPRRRNTRSISSQARTPATIQAADERSSGTAFSAVIESITRNAARIYKAIGSQRAK